MEKIFAVVLLAIGVALHNPQPPTGVNSLEQATLVEPIKAKKYKKAEKVKFIGRKELWLKSAGIAPEDWASAKYILDHENGLWCPTRWNGQNHCPETPTDYNPTGGSSAYGMCQALPGPKMSSAGKDWKTNPITQLKWCDSYAKNRYGSWQAAEKFWKSRSWW